MYAEQSCGAVRGPPEDVGTPGPKLNRKTNRFRGEINIFFELLENSIGYWHTDLPGVLFFSVLFFKPARVGNPVDFRMRGLMSVS